MDIRIGITNSPREINFESSQNAGEIEKIVASALESKSSYISLKDDKGKLYVIPTAALGYVEIGSDTSRRVGFVA
ncbi:DUF3107 domain-containing protein [Marisediminicola antarctica]|uniref:ATP-binding protein n=1 Tax=Marisediminicola antarctica TaxID=674079 RepID=A0A7L5AG04_9MICO|nr:DUF3107 domain-containing protein [Marisediminicola antarctica]QHO69428.1 ATP-binding protein [Marisediminicola antarctica]